MPFINGKWIHHDDCYWCQYHTEIPIKIVKEKVKQVREQCGLTSDPIPFPGQPGRYCEHYIQKNCGCNLCIPFVTGD